MSACRDDPPTPPPTVVRWAPDDQLVIEVERAALQLGLGFEDTVSLLVGMGIAAAQEAGLVSGRATTPMDPAELFRRLAAHLLGADQEGKGKR